MSLKVMHVEAGRHLYGGALQVFYLMRELHVLGVENVLVCPQGSDIARESKSVATVCETPMKGDLDFTLSLRIKKLAKQHQCDILHAHSRRGADVWTGFAADFSSIPAVLTRRVDNPEAPWLAKFKVKKYQKVTAISHGIREVMLQAGVSPEKVTTIHSAVDQEKFRPEKSEKAFRKRFDLREEHPVIGVIAQLIERKGHRYLFDIAPRVLQKFPYLKILIFGKGPQKDALETQVKELGISHAVSFVGFQADMETIIPNLDLVVHPALMEGLGVSLLQASACEVPIVAAASGGIPEIVRDKENGLLVPAADSEALFDALTLLLEDKQMREDFGKCGRRIVESEFSTKTMAQAYVALYHSLLGGASDVPTPNA
ncbi:MAG: glycosyltransferase family 4 protein [Agarilytica sp.]